MSIVTTARRYFDTARHLHASQIAFRLLRRAGFQTPLKRGHVPNTRGLQPSISRIPALTELDFDPAFLSRFDCDEILENRLTFLHVPYGIDWTADAWRASSMAPLWQFNLHYCEYLLPLAKRFLDQNDPRCLDKAKEIITSWIRENPPEKGGPGWEPYTISLRAVNWLAFYSEVQEALGGDNGFIEAMNRSLEAQYVFLAQHLEKDLLANHYLEDLKALVVLACYYGDEETLGLLLPEFYAQLDEQILPDGVHFELSPMYQKIILEDLIRVASCLACTGHDVEKIIGIIGAMGDFVYSAERNANRTPLFNDSGDNVSKSADTLIDSLRIRFSLTPEYKTGFPDSGYYFLERRTKGHVVKLIFDAGRPGPDYAMGHAHCDALSVECFIDGRPWIVNCGTYAYQDERRLDFKQTASHSTVMAEGSEQSECWAPFRVARCSSSRLVSQGPDILVGECIDKDKHVITRTVRLLEDGVSFEDRLASDAPMVGYWHFAKRPDCVVSAVHAYAPEFGLLEDAYTVRRTGLGSMNTFFEFPT